MKKPPLSIDTVGLCSSNALFGDAVLIDGCFAFAPALALAFGARFGCSTLMIVLTGVTGVERAITLLRNILILPVGAGAVDPWSDEVVIGVTESVPVVELANKESLSLAIAGITYTTRVSWDTTADNPCEGSKQVVRKGNPSRSRKNPLYEDSCSSFGERSVGGPKCCGGNPAMF